jgi:hypothetical protein
MKQESVSVEIFSATHVASPVQAAWQAAAVPEATYKASLLMEK